MCDGNKTHNNTNTCSSDYFHSDAAAFFKSTLNFYNNDNNYYDCKETIKNNAHVYTCTAFHVLIPDS